MRKVLAFLVVAMVAAGAVWVMASGSRPDSPPAAEPPMIGKQAPDFSLPDLEGNLVSLADFRGKVVMLNFWATWCPPCRMEMPSMERLKQAFAGKDFAMLAVSADTEGKSAVSSFLGGRSFSFTILLDPSGEAQSLYGVYKFPETFIIDRDGKIVEKVIGGLDWSSPESIGYFRQLIGE